MKENRERLSNQIEEENISIQNDDDASINPEIVMCSVERLEFEDYNFIIQAEEIPVNNKPFSEISEKEIQTLKSSNLDYSKLLITANEEIEQLKKDNESLTNKLNTTRSLIGKLKQSESFYYCLTNLMNISTLR